MQTVIFRRVRRPRLGQDCSSSRCHSLAFQAVLLPVALIAGGWFMAAWLMILLAPVHLFYHMRGTYGTSFAGTLARMLLLLVGSGLGFVVLFALLVIVGLSAET